MIAGALLGCGGGADPGSEQPPEGELGELTVSSRSFGDGEDIPVEHTCDGEDVSPHLEWSDPPSGVKSFTIIVDDPDAPGGSFIHWTLYNLPGGLRSLQEGAALPKEALQGENGFGRISYGGPCPPAGSAHEYRFWVYAVSEDLPLERGAQGIDVIAALRGRVIAVGSVNGKYARPQR